MSARIISTVGRAINVIVAGRVVSHLRFAAGVCVLAAALLMGGSGGAVAVADPNSSGCAAHGGAGTTASRQQASTGAKGPKKAPGGTDSEDGTLGSAPHPGQQPSGAKGPKKAVPNVGAPAPTAAAAPTPTAAAAPAPTAVAAEQGRKVGRQLRQRDRRGGASSGRIERHRRCCSVGSCGCGGGVTIAAGLPATGTSGSPESSRNTGVATLGRTTLGATTSLPGMAPPASNGAIPMGVRSFLRHALPDLPVAVPLAALAAVALPAVGVLVILTLAGVRVGYRQDKADFALRTAGIARFARRRAGQGAASRRRSSP
jgi:hypothetical protein